MPVYHHKDKKIFYIDHENLKEEELLENMRAATKVMLDHKDDRLLVLINFTGVYMTDAVNEELKSKDGLESMEYMKKTALLGVTGIKKIFLNAYNQMTGKQLKAFNTRDEALEYLAAD